MIYLFLTTVIIVLTIIVYISYNAKAIAASSLPENIKVELRAHRETYGLTDVDWIPYNLEYKEVNDDHWYFVTAFQKCKNSYSGEDTYDIIAININNENELNTWKERLKTLKDIEDFHKKQEDVMKLWKQRQEDKNCIY